MCVLSECTDVLYTWPPVGNFRPLPSAHWLVECNIRFTRCVATLTSIVFGVLLSGALSTLLRLTAEGIVGVKEDWIVGAERETRSEHEQQRYRRLLRIQSWGDLERRGQGPGVK